MATKLPREFQITPKYTVSDWNALNLDENQPGPDWVKAIAILRDRIEGRFLKPAARLIKIDEKKKRGTYGFAILALDFLVIETIQGFKEGLDRHTGQSEALFVRFFSAWDAFLRCVPHGGNVAELARQLYLQGRCALHHSGATDKLIVGRRGDMLTFHPDGRISVNRTAFHQNLEDAFRDYLADLAQQGSQERRRQFKSKMAHICGN